MKKSLRRVITTAAIGAGVGYLASKGVFIDPAAPAEFAQHMTANLPSTPAAMATGAAVAGTGRAGYELGKHNALGTQWD